jgi:hypothetical protein
VISRMHQVHHPIWLGLLLLGLLICMPRLTLADAPGTRGPQRASVGAAEHTLLWSDVQPMPPLDQLLRPPASEVAQPGAASTHTFTLPAPLSQDDSGGSSWMSRVLNPGNWIMDAGMGISTGLLATMSDIVLATVRHLIDVPDGCIGVIFCTPESTLFESAGVISVSLAAVWERLIPVAGMLLTCFFVLRVGQIAMAGPHQFGTEGRSLVITMIAALVMITQSGPFLRALVTLFNSLNGAILAMDGTRLLELIISRPPLNFGVILTQLIFFLMLLCLLFVGYLRLFKLFLLFALAPLMGALLMAPAQVTYFRNWVNTILALLVEQTVWVVAFMIGITLAMPGGTIPDISDPANNAETIRHFVGATIAIVLALCSRSLLNNVFHAVVPSGASFGMFRALATWQLVRRTLGGSGVGNIGRAAARGTVQGSAGSTGGRAGHQGSTAAGGQTGSGMVGSGPAAGLGGQIGAGAGSARSALAPAARTIFRTRPAYRHRTQSSLTTGQARPGDQARAVVGRRGRELDVPIVAAGVRRPPRHAGPATQQATPTPVARRGGARIYTAGAASQYQDSALLPVDEQFQPVSRGAPQRSAVHQHTWARAHEPSPTATLEQGSLPTSSAVPRRGRSAAQRRLPGALGAASVRRRASHGGIIPGRGMTSGDLRHTGSARAAPRRPAVVRRRIGTPFPGYDEQDTPRQGTSQHRPIIRRRSRLAWHASRRGTTVTRFTMQQRLAMEELATPLPSATRLHGDSHPTGTSYHRRITPARMHRPSRLGRWSGQRPAAQQPGKQSDDGPHATRMRTVRHAMLRRRSRQFRREARREEP